MDYYKVITNDDIKYLMNEFNFFHDSCMKEVKYVSGSYVEKDGSINPFNSLRNLSVIFQSQSSKYPVIELVFEGIHKVTLLPKKDDYDCIIYIADLKKINNIFYWAEWEKFNIEDCKKDYGSWISAEGIKWRVIENALGDNEFYISNL